MSNTKWTKGAWIPYCPRELLNVGYITVENGDGELIYCIDAHKRRLKEYTANAHLIAAAPEMYEMLESTCIELLHVISKLNDYERKDYNCGQSTPPDLTDMETCQLIQVLLAKARGE